MKAEQWQSQQLAGATPRTSEDGEKVAAFDFKHTIAGAKRRQAAS
jgi:hypothetical protein